MLTLMLTILAMRILLAHQQAQPTRKNKERRRALRDARCAIGIGVGVGVGARARARAAAAQQQYPGFEPMISRLQNPPLYHSTIAA